jgi:luciferase family oxidoreductase group 1
MPPFKLSVLDLSLVPSGSSGRQALLNTLDLARLADRLGFTRYWLSEHHNSIGLASAAPEILIGHVADATRRIRVGSGGIMLPNHASLKVAEGFRMLEALHPGRIDLGLGRAPGTDLLTAQALRRSGLGHDSFPGQIEELLGFLGNSFPPGHPYERVIAVPEDAPSPGLWMLSSSGYGAQVAARLGLGLAFAHHIHPEPAVAALRFYREGFQPSAQFQEPQAILCVAAVCADDDETAQRLASSFDLVRLRIEQGRSGKFPSPEEAAAYPYEAAEQARILENRSRFFVGSPGRVQAQLTALALEAGVDEIMVLGMVHDHQARRRSYELLAEAFGLEAGAA